MNLLIFLDLTYNPCKNFKFYSLQGQNVQPFLIFTYNQGQIILILPITRGRHMYTWSPMGIAPPPLTLSMDFSSFLNKWLFQNIPSVIEICIIGL